VSLSEQREVLQPYLASARTAAELKRVQCIWLREMLGLDIDRIALATGLSPNTVKQYRSSFLREGEQALKPAAARGGRPRCLTPEAEAELVGAFVRYARCGGYIDAARFQAAAGRKAGHPVSMTTVYRILARQGARGYLLRRRK
jgi:transposase